MKPGKLSTEGGLSQQREDDNLLVGVQLQHQLKQVDGQRVGATEHFAEVAPLQRRQRLNVVPSLEHGNTNAYYIPSLIYKPINPSKISRTYYRKGVTN